ncbi:MAG: hypothetical protein PWQ77_1535 [Kosmotogales bacterium]|nr:hypothetical protein [Kosmotogales bacterium]
MIVISKGRTAEIYRLDGKKVLKLFYQDFPLSEVELEYENNLQIQSTGLKIPEAFELYKINGRYGIVYEKISGNSMLMEMFSNTEKISEYMRILAEVHSEIHKNTVDKLTSHDERLKRDIYESPVLSVPEKDRLLMKLKEATHKGNLCHGDFHPDNVIISEEGPVVIDWITAAKGNPVADIARTVILIAVSEPVDNFGNTEIKEDLRKFLCREYVNGYEKICPFPRDDLFFWIPIVAGARLNENVPRNEKIKLYNLAIGGEKLEL